MTFGNLHLNVHIEENMLIPIDHSCYQCDQKKIAKCLKTLPKNDFTRKMIDFDIFTKIA